MWGVPDIFIKLQKVGLIFSVFGWVISKIQKNTIKKREFTKKLFITKKDNLSCTYSVWSTSLSPS